MTVLIVEILPVHAAPERDTGIAALWQRVVLDDLLALPEHGDASAGVERDGKGLQLRHVRANAKGDIALTTDTGRSAKAVNQMFVVVRIEVLERSDGCRNAVEVPRRRVAAKVWIEQMHKAIIDIAMLRHVFRFIEQGILPGGIRVGIAQNGRWIVQVLRTLDNTAVALRILEARNGQ